MNNSKLPSEISIELSEKMLTFYKKAVNKLIHIKQQDITANDILLATKLSKSLSESYLNFLLAEASIAKEECNNNIFKLKPVIYSNITNTKQN